MFLLLEAFMSDGMKVQPFSQSPNIQTPTEGVKPSKRRNAISPDSPAYRAAQAVKRLGSSSENQQAAKISEAHQVYPEPSPSNKPATNKTKTLWQQFVAFFFGKKKEPLPSQPTASSTKPAPDVAKDIKDLISKFETNVRTPDITHAAEKYKNPNEVAKFNKDSIETRSDRLDVAYEQMKPEDKEKLLKPEAQEILKQSEIGKSLLKRLEEVPTKIIESIKEKRKEIPQPKYVDIIKGLDPKDIDILKSDLGQSIIQKKPGLLAFNANLQQAHPSAPSSPMAPAPSSRKPVKPPPPVSQRASSALAEPPISAAQSPLGPGNIAPAVQEAISPEKRAEVAPSAAAASKPSSPLPSEPSKTPSSEQEISKLISRIADKAEEYRNQARDKAIKQNPRDWMTTAHKEGVDQAYSELSPTDKENLRKPEAQKILKQTVVGIDIHELLQKEVPQSALAREPAPSSPIAAALSSRKPVPPPPVNPQAKAASSASSALAADQVKAESSSVPPSPASSASKAPATPSAAKSAVQPATAASVALTPKENALAAIKADSLKGANRNSSIIKKLAKMAASKKDRPKLVKILILMKSEVAPKIAQLLMENLEASKKLETVGLELVKDLITEQVKIESLEDPSTFLRSNAMPNLIMGEFYKKVLDSSKVLKDDIQNVAKAIKKSEYILDITYNKDSQSSTHIQTISNIQKDLEAALDQVVVLSEHVPSAIKEFNRHLISCIKERYGEDHFLANLYVPQPLFLRFIGPELAKRKKSTSKPDDTSLGSKSAPLVIGKLLLSLANDAPPGKEEEYNVFLQQFKDRDSSFSKQLDIIKKNLVKP